MREIITLQFGGYANYVGTHFWNLQDELFAPIFSDGSTMELDPTILYRMSRDALGREYTSPRALIFDINDSLGMTRARTGGVHKPATPTVPGGGGGAAAGGAASGGGGGGGGGWMDGMPGSFDRRSGAGAASGGSSSSAGGGGGSSSSSGGLSSFHRYLDAMDSYESSRAASAASGGRGGGGGATSSMPVPPALPDLATTVESWGDYVKAPFSARSFVGLGGPGGLSTTHASSLTSAAATSSAGGRDASTLNAAAPFNAFTDGLGLLGDDLMEDTFRHQLEDCDGLQGVTAIVDVDSGFGGIAVEYLRYVRDECPRTAIVVMPALAPPPHPSTAASAAASGGGAFDYSSRDRADMRARNSALAMALFGGGSTEIDAQVLPLSMAAVAAAAAGGGSGGRWLSRLSRSVDLGKPYVSSAFLALAWDMFTSPVRVDASFASARGASASGGSGVLGVADVPIPPSFAGEAAVIDPRAAGTGGSAGRSTASSSDRASSSSAAAAAAAASSFASSGSSGSVVGLASSIRLGSLIAGLRPTGAHRISTLALAYPSPVAALSAADFGAYCNGAGSGGPPPLHLAPADRFCPVSAFTPHESGWLRGAVGVATPPVVTPFAHALVTRGVGCTAVASGRYVDAADAYGRAMDALMARSPCGQAAHAFLRSPLPVPVSFPRVFAEEDAAHPACGSDGLPAFAPGQLHVETGPIVGQDLSHLRDLYAARDHSLRHRYAPDGSYGGLLTESDVADALEGLIDDYAPPEKGGGSA